MTHARRTVRNAFTAALAGISVPVESGRVWRHNPPAVCVYSPSEVTDEVDHLTRTVQIDAEARVLAVGAVDDVVDDLCAEIEAAIGRDRTLGGVVLDVWPPTTEIELSEEGEKPIAFATLSFPVLYRIGFDGEPGTIIN